MFQWLRSIFLSHRSIQARCSFCQTATQPLVEGPREVFICSRCLAIAEAAESLEANSPAANSQAATPSAADRELANVNPYAPPHAVTCSFCEASTEPIRLVSDDDAAAICETCVRTGGDLLTIHAATR